MTRANIVIFGEAGSGKSSIVNMLADNDVAGTSTNGRFICTLQSKGYDANILGIPVCLWDTPGLGGGVPDQMLHLDAITQLYKLVRSLSEGISLLIFVMRAPRINDSTLQNWRLLHEVICQKQVPIIVVITALEEEDDMDRFWWDNKGILQSRGIFPSGSACITATRGRVSGREGRRIFDDEFEESQMKLRRIIASTCLNVPWRVPPAEWFKKSTRQDWIFGLRLQEETHEVPG